MRWGTGSPVRRAVPAGKGRAARFAFAAVVLAAAAAACLDDSITGVRELRILLTPAASTVSVGDSVTFDFVAQGTGLAHVHVDYGDGVADTISFGGGFETPAERAHGGDTLFYRGPVEVAGRLVHAFDAPGSYVVVGHAIGLGGAVSDSVALTVH